MDMRPEHVPVGCVAMADRCTFKGRNGEVCGLYANMHRPVRKRERKRGKQKESRSKLLGRLEVKVRMAICRDVAMVLKEGEKKSKVTKVWDGVFKRREDVVSCVECRSSFGEMIHFDQHIDVSKYPEKWGACRRWRREIVRCARCRKRFYHLFRLRRHLENDYCKEYRKGKRDEGKDEKQTREKGVGESEEEGILSVRTEEGDPREWVR